jgi:hypothetical protein
MPTLSSSNRSQLSYKLEGTYPTNFGVPQGGNGVLMNMTSENFDYSVKTEMSKQLRQDRSVADIVQVGASALGGFNFEAQYKEYDPFLEGIAQSAYTVYGTLGVSAVVVTLTLTSTTITAGVAPTGSSQWTDIKKGQWIKVIPPAGATQTVKDYFNGRVFRVSLVTAPTSTVITLDAATPINTTTGGTSISNGFIATSRLENGNVMKSYTIEVQHSDITQFRQYTGMIPSKMDLKLGVGAIITGSFEFMGKSMNLIQATSMGTPAAAQTYTPANATRGVFDILEGGSSVSALTYIKSADLSFDNKLRIQDAVGVFGAAGVGAGTMNIGGKLEVYFAEHTLYGKLISGAASSLALPILDVDGNGYVYYFPRIKYTAAKVATGGQDQDNMLSMEFSAIPDVTVGSDTLGKTLVIYRCGVAV